MPLPGQAFRGSHARGQAKRSYAQAVSQSFAEHAQAQQVVQDVEARYCQEVEAYIPGAIMPGCQAATQWSNLPIGGDDSPYLSPFSSFQLGSLPTHAFDYSPDTPAQIRCGPPHTQALQQHMTYAQPVCTGGAGCYK
jgi:hypothetical protein